MVNTTAVRTGLLVGGALFALLFVGTVWRFLSRIVSFAVLGLVVLAAVYVAYEIHSGWLAADPDGERERTESPVAGPETDREPASQTELDEELQRLREETSEEAVSTHDEQEFETETET